MPDVLYKTIRKDKLAQVRSRGLFPEDRLKGRKSCVLLTTLAKAREETRNNTTVILEVQVTELPSFNLSKEGEEYCYFGFIPSKLIDLTS